LAFLPVASRTRTEGGGVPRSPSPRRSGRRPPGPSLSWRGLHQRPLDPGGELALEGGLGLPPGGCPPSRDQAGGGGGAVVEDQVEDPPRPPLEEDGPPCPSSGKGQGPGFRAGSSFSSSRRDGVDQETFHFSEGHQKGPCGAHLVEAGDGPTGRAHLPTPASPTSMTLWRGQGAGPSALAMSSRAWVMFGQVGPTRKRSGFRASARHPLGRAPGLPSGPRGHAVVGFPSPGWASSRLPFVGSGCCPALPEGAPHVSPPPCFRWWGALSRRCPRAH
jgi:hypothetical protein